ncbi:MAG TPA: hypothetical protein VFO12_10830 [Sphingomicrobium sp.]|nr:hypothetical protein [Sphingomicrobium sp.]
MQKSGWWRAGAAALAFAVSAAAIAGSGHQWGNYLWEENSEKLQLEFAYSFANEGVWAPYYRAALAKWEVNVRSPLDLTDRGRDSGTDPATCAAKQGIVLVCAAAYGQTGWVGIASIETEGNYIRLATAKFNDTYYATPSYNNDGQRQFVACHEIGHTFGLGHLDTSFNNRNKGSCMDYTSNPVGPPDNRSPGTVDWDVLNSTTMYGDLVIGKGKGGGGKPGKATDPFEFRTVGDAAPGAAPDNRRYPWGIAVGFDDEGRPVEFLEDLGRGRTRRTFITWVRGHRPRPLN